MNRFQRRRQRARAEGRCCVCFAQNPPLGRTVCLSCNEQAKLRVRKRRESLKSAPRPSFEPSQLGQRADLLTTEGLVREAIIHYEAAGDIALGAGNFAEAVDSYRRAIALEVQRNDTPSTLMRKLARALQLAGAPDEAAELAQQLVELGGASASEEVARDLGFLGMVSWEGAKREIAYQYISQAVNLPGDGSVHFENLTNAAWLSYELGNTTKATELLDRAAKLRAKVQIQARARFLDVRGRTRLSAGLVEQGFADFRAAIDLAERAPSRDLYFAVAGNYADNAELVGDFEEAQTIWKRLRARARIGHMGWRDADAALNAALCRIALGDLIGAERLVDAALMKPLTCAAVRIHAAVAGIVIGLLRDRQDLIDRCADESVIGLALQSKEAVRIGPTIAAFSLLAISQKRFDDARSLLDMGVAALRTADHAFAMLVAAAEYSNMDIARSAQRLLKGSSELRRDRLSTAYSCLLDSIASRREGASRDSRDKASAAAMLFARLEMPYWQARALELCGKPREALRMYREIGDIYDSRRLEAIFASRRARSSTMRLTPRLDQVARLIAQGLSNKAAAARLGLSEKTINNHLQAIYGRLGLSSRAQLIAHFLKQP